MQQASASDQDTMLRAARAPFPAMEIMIPLYIYPSTDGVCSTLLVTGFARAVSTIIGLIEYQMAHA